MTLLDIPDDFITSKEEDKIIYNFNLTVFTREDEVKFALADVATSWMSPDDNFIRRINFERLNPYFLKDHLLKEIEIKNILDFAEELLGSEKFMKAVEMLDEVLYYDPCYGEALLFKSKALFGQKHFVKSLRHYKKAIKADSSLMDIEYHKLLLKKSSEERDSFPVIKRNIYAGDEYFAKGDYEKALESYNRALANPTDFKNRILSKLLNKKATALVEMDRISEAMETFRKSLSVKPNDYAYFYLGVFAQDFTPEIAKAKNISKTQLLVKAGRLNDFGKYDMALECLDEFFENHYVTDDDYMAALKLKLDIMNELGRDASEVETVLNCLKT